MPELENQQQGQPQDPPNPLDTTNNTPNPEQNNATPAPPAEDAIATLRSTYMGVLRESQQREQQLQAELERVRNQQNQSATPQHNPEQDVELLTTNPRELIRQELRNTLMPLQEQVQQFTRTQEVANVIGQVRNDPRFEHIGIPEVETYFKNVLNTVPQININTVLAAYQMAVGNYIQNGGTFTPKIPTPLTPTPTTHSQSVPTPPPTPRSAPPIIPSNQPKRPKREYTENEKLLMKLNNMTEEQYEAEMNLLPQQVVTGPAQ